MTMPDTRRHTARDAILLLLLIAPMSVPELADQYARLRRAGGWPDVAPATIATTTSLLHRAGRIEDTGHRRSGRGHRNVVVWRAVP